jgi:hypothetical protein
MEERRNSMLIVQARIAQVIVGTGEVRRMGSLR